MKSNWYEDFFDQVTLDVWQTVIPAEMTGQECEFLEQVLSVPKGARILDIPCGHGRHSIELARRGYDVTGVDLSRPFLAEAQRRSAAEGVPVRWEREHMNRIRYSREFDGCFCWGNSFGYLEREENAEFIGAAAGALKQGAQFILETGVAAESVLPDFQEDTWGAFGDYLFLERHQYDITAGRLDVESISVRDGTVTKRNYIQYVYSCAELIRMLSTAGLETQAMYGALDRTPYRLGSRDLILVARRV